MSANPPDDLQPCTREDPGEFELNGSHGEGSQRRIAIMHPRNFRVMSIVGQYEYQNGLVSW